MFTILHRYVFRELLRIFSLTTIALTLILSLGSILRPIQQYGVGPQQIVRLLFYFLPVTLTFVLPMAALFAATLCYGRLAGDNEIDACKASGVSPLTLVYPGFILAILVAMANLALSFYVMPNYVHKAERAIKADARQILFRNLQRRGYYSLPGLRFSVYADNANLETNILSGVIAVQSRGSGVSEIFTTEDARVSFREDGHQTRVRIDAYNLRQVGRPNTPRFTAERPSMEYPFGSLLADKISFKRVHEMKRIQADPISFRPIAEGVDRVREQLVLELMLQDINDVIAAEQEYPLLGDPNAVRLRAGGASLGRDRINLYGGLAVVEYEADTGRKIRSLECDKGTLYVETRQSPPVLTLALANASRSDRIGVTMRHQIRDLKLPAGLVPYYGGNQLRALLSDAVFTSLRSGPSADLNARHKVLVERYRTTMKDIQSEIHTRLVFGLGCIPMILIGIGLGILKRGGHMLSAFGASCLPALVLVIGIVSGKQLNENLHNEGMAGIALVWGGLAALCLIFAHVYRKLIRC
jgi:lipopolysaccharide export LptBFGC system permease protein LptF